VLNIGTVVNSDMRPYYIIELCLAEKYFSSPTRKIVGLADDQKACGSHTKIDVHVNYMRNNRIKKCHVIDVGGG